MVKVTVGRSGELQGPEADVIESLVVNAERLIGVLNELVDRQSCVVWLHDHVRHLQQQKYCNVSSNPQDSYSKAATLEKETFKKKLKCYKHFYISPLITHADGSRVSIASICLCDSVRTIKPTQLKLKLPNLAQSITICCPPMNIRSKVKARIRVRRSSL